MFCLYCETNWVVHFVDSFCISSLSFSESRVPYCIPLIGFSNFHLAINILSLSSSSSPYLDYYNKIFGLLCKQCLTRFISNECVPHPQFSTPYSRFLRLYFLGCNAPGGVGLFPSLPLLPLPHLYHLLHCLHFCKSASLSPPSA